jgi:hypothetical protein
MKNNRKIPKALSKKKHKLSPIKMFFMNALRSWCNEPKSRTEKTSRKQEIARVLQKDIQTLKNMYLYGQGSLDHWFRAMDHISHLKQETIIQMYDSYELIENKLNSFSEEELKLHRYMKELSEAELALVNSLIETGLKVNRLSKR